MCDLDSGAMVIFPLLYGGKTDIKENYSVSLKVEMKYLGPYIPKQDPSKEKLICLVCVPRAPRGNWLYVYI